MKKPTLYLYGTVHGSKKTKSDLRNIFNRYKIDAVLSEGVKTQYQKMFQKEPFLACPWWVYFNCIKIMGSEFTLAKELANNSEIPIINIDKSLNELIEYFHKPYNNIVLIIIIADILLTFHNFIMLGLFMVELFYFLYFVLKVRNWRDEFFYENIKETIENKPYNSVLIICGELHTNFIKKMFDCIDLTKGF